jgi:hypothetical protein
LRVFVAFARALAEDDTGRELGKDALSLSRS